MATGLRGRLASHIREMMRPDEPRATGENWCDRRHVARRWSRLWNSGNGLEIKIDTTMLYPDGFSGNVRSNWGNVWAWSQDCR
jgi:hypothetical protein